MLRKLVRHFGTSGTMQLGQYSVWKKRGAVKRHSILADIEFELKNIAFLTANNPNIAKDEEGISHLESPQFRMINANAAALIHKQPESTTTLFNVIKTSFENALGMNNLQLIPKIFEVMKNPLFQTEQIHAFLVSRLEEMLTNKNEELFVKCIQANKVFLKPFLKANQTREVTMWTMKNSEQYDHFELDFEFRMEESENNRSQVEVDHNNLLEGEDTGKEKNDQVVLFGTNGEKYELQNVFLKLVQIELEGNIFEWKEYLLEKVDKNKEVFALYLLLQMEKNENRDDDISNAIQSSVQRFLKDDEPVSVLEFCRKCLETPTLIGIEEMTVIADKLKDRNIRFAIGCIKSILLSRVQSLNLGQLASLIIIANAVLSSSQYSRDCELENLLLHDLIEGRIFSDTSFDDLNLRGCFYQLIRLVGSLKACEKHQEVLLHMSLSLYGDSLIKRTGEDTESQGFNNSVVNMESVERLTSCCSLISKDVRDWTGESKGVLMCVIESVLLGQMYRGNADLLVNLMDLLVNTNLIFDKESIDEVNSYAKSNITELLMKDAARDSKEITRQNRRMRLSSYIRFIAKFKYIKQLDPNEFSDMIASLPKSDRQDPRLYQSLYESILHNHSLWLLDDLSSIRHIQNICSVIMKLIPWNLNPIGLCTSLRNYLLRNALALKHLSISLVDVSKYSLQNPLVSSEEQQTLIIPFKVDLIVKTQPENRSLQMFFESLLVSPKQADTSFQIDSLLAQMQSKVIKMEELCESIRGNPNMRTLLQSNQAYFNTVKKYAIFLLGNYGPNLAPSNDPKLSQENSSDKTCTEILFFVRMVLEKDMDSLPTDLMKSFIRANVERMEFLGVLFSKEMVNTYGIKDPDIHQLLQKRLSEVLKKDDINFRSALTLLKSFSLSSFDEKTLFLLENQIIHHINVINPRNLEVLCKKYFYNRSSGHPVKFITGISQNMHLFFKAINNQSVWCFFLLDRFKPSVFDSLPVQSISLDPLSLSKSNLVRLIKAFTQRQVEASLRSTLQKNSSQPATNKCFNEIFLRQTEEEELQEETEREERTSLLQKKVLEFMRLNNQQGSTNEENILSSCIDVEFTPSIDTLGNAYEYIHCVYSFHKRGNPSFIQQNVQELGLLLWRQYSEGKEINISQLVRGNIILQHFNCSKQVNFLKQSQIMKVMNASLLDNRTKTGLESPCLQTIAMIYHILCNYTQANQPENDHSQTLGDLIRSNFLFYKFKKNETKEDIINWIHLIGNNISSHRHIFNRKDFEVLDKLENIFLKRIHFFPTHDVLDIFNAYFQYDLCSFQILEACDAFLIEQDQRQQVLLQRYQTRQLKTANNSLLPDQHF